MSERLRHTMYHFEAAPPSAAWEAISARLDDDTAFDTLAKRMQAASIQPPTDNWQQIAARLSDDQQYHDLSLKILSASAVPPAAAWQQIASVLDEQQPSTIPLPAKRRPVYRMAAAAAVAVLLLGAWLLTAISGSNHLSIDISGALTQPPSAGTSSPTTPTNAQPQTQINNADRFGAESLAGNQKTNTGPSGAVRPGRPLKYAVVSDIYTLPETSIVIASPPIVDQYGQVIHDLEVLTTNNNYLSILGPNGETTRISAKFANVIRYLNGDTEEPTEYLDNVIRDSDTWKKRFQEWRSKIRESSFIPSTANFMDILSFKDLLEQDK